MLVNWETLLGVHVLPWRSLADGKSLFLTVRRLRGVVCEGHAAKALALPLQTSVPFHDACGHLFS